MLIAYYIPVSGSSPLQYTQAPANKNRAASISISTQHPHSAGTGTGTWQLEPATKTKYPHPTQSGRSTPTRTAWQLTTAHVNNSTPHTAPSTFYFVRSTRRSTLHVTWAFVFMYCSCTHGLSGLLREDAIIFLWRHVLHSTPTGGAHVQLES